MSRYSAPLLALLVPLLAFSSGWLAHLELGRAEVAPVQSPPTFVAEFASAFCSADGEYVAAHSGGDLQLTTEQANELFARREWRCDRVRYLGSSAGKRGTAYIFVLQDGSGGLENWWAFTTDKGVVVRVD